MRLDRLVAEASSIGPDLAWQLLGDPAADVRGVTMDSRAVVPWTLFACVPGQHVDGHDFAPLAVAEGASALLCERHLDLAAPQVIVSSVRRAVGPVAASVYGHPSRDLTVVGVTGTNGKTTTCALLAAIFESHGWRSTVVGTLTQARTTPEAPDLQALLAAWRDSGGRAVAMEVSSHALAQHRPDAVWFAVGIFTNLTPEHLDFHHTMEEYFETKASLFVRERIGMAVINTDDDWGKRLAGMVERQGVVVETFGIRDAEDVHLAPEGSTFRYGGETMKLRLGGRFNVENAVAAATCARALGVAPADIVEGLASVGGVRGRFERVDAGQPFTVLVDYAHTPDGLAQVLRAARELSGGRLVVVFGAGGDRDHEKRPLMGAAATELADLAIVTSDNPRSEDPRAIIEQVVAGATDASRYVVEADRAAAISAALAAAAPGDIVVIAGRGHETGQEAGGRIVPFDDVEVARTALVRILGSREEDG